jgi:hypothetical protein
VPSLDSELRRIEHPHSQFAADLLHVNSATFVAKLELRAITNSQRIRDNPVIYLLQCHPRSIPALDRVSGALMRVVAPALALPNKPSIAVLPFHNLRGASMRRPAMRDKYDMRHRRSRYSLYCGAWLAFHPYSAACT